jgi:hypothetical protein
LSWVGKGQALLVFQRWDLALAKNQMCLTERWLFLYAAQRPYTRHMAYISALAEWRHLCIFNI